MGSASRRARHSPKRLAEKLLHIRLALGLSQNEMLKRLGEPEALQQSSISGYEREAREPPLLLLLAYARVAGVCIDVLIDDDLDLPAKLPSTPKHAGVRRSATRAGRRPSS